MRCRGSVHRRSTFRSGRSIQPDAEMIVGELGRYTASGSAVQEADLNKKWLVNFLNCVRFFGERSGQGIHAHWTALIFLYDCEEKPTVHFIESVAVNFEHLQ